MTLGPDDLAREFAQIPAKVAFRHRPDPIPGDLRMSWRLSALVLVLDRCRAKTANFEQLNILLWALRTPEAWERVRGWFSGVRDPGEIAVRLDPAVRRTIGIAVASGLVHENRANTVKLTESGRRLAEEIWTAEVMLDEKKFLRSLPKAISQKSVREALES